MPPLMRLSASLSSTLPLAILSLPHVCHSFAFPISLLCFPCLSSVPSFFHFPITSLFPALSASQFSSQLLSSVLLFPYQAFPTQLSSCSFPCSLSPPVLSVSLFSVLPASIPFCSPSLLLPRLSAPLPSRWMCRCCQPLTQAKISGSGFM